MRDPLATHASFGRTVPAALDALARRRVVKARPGGRKSSIGFGRQTHAKTAPAALD